MPVSTDMPAPRVRLQQALAPERARLGAGGALGVLASLLWIGQAALIAAVFARLLEGQGGLAPLPAALGFLGLAVARAGLTYGSEGLLFRAAEAVLARERWVLLAREARAAQNGGFGGPGAVSALAGEKLHALQPYITRYAPAQMRVAVVTLAILVLAFWHSWAVGVVLLVAGPLIPVFMALIGWAAQEASERQMIEIGSLNDLLVDRLAALADIRLLDAGDSVTARFAGAAEDLRVRTMAVLRIAFLSSTVLELFAALGVAMVAVWVGFSLLDLIGWGAWGGPIGPWAGMFLLLLAPDYFQPLRDLAGAWHDRASALAVAGELAAWEEAAPPEILGEGQDVPALPGAPTIRWQGLVAARGGRRIVFPDAEIAPGARIGISGPSGAGKTTLLRMLAGLQRPAEGRIEVCGVALDAASADGWRARLGWMPQAPHFLNSSLRHNIGFGVRPDPEVLRRTVLEEVIGRLPRGDLTVLGETGGGLSGGEARRAMLARALQARPDVLLVDEPTADLDADTALLVTEGLIRLAAEGCTLIVATHDPRLLERMDRVVQVEGAP